MKTRHRKDIKKLSTAILRGAQIAKENGIGQGKFSLIHLDSSGDIECACALGMALIGVCGVEGAKKLTNDNGIGDGGYGILEDMFPDMLKVNTCLVKKVKNHLSTTLVQDIVTDLNDSYQKSPAEVAELLSECSL